MTTIPLDEVAPAASAGALRRPIPRTVPTWELGVITFVDELVQRHLLTRRHSSYLIVDLDGSPHAPARCVQLANLTI